VYSECILHNFAYLNGFDVHLLQIQNCCKVNKNEDMVLPEDFFLVFNYRYVITFVWFEIRVVDLD
jgi:hypothetical protein